MSTIDRLLTALREDQMVRDVTGRHDDARIAYTLTRNTVGDYREFAQIIGDYYNHHFTRCISRGGRLPPGEAQARAKALLDRLYRRRNGDAMTAAADAMAGVNNGLRGVIDQIADALKSEAMEFRVNEMFDQYVTPNSWDEKVAIIRAFIDRCGVNLAASIDVDRPERYARDYRELIQAYVEGLREPARQWRRL